MANKKTDVNLKGILNSLEDSSEEIQNNNSTETKIIQDTKKKNRSFMLTENTIKQLKELSFISDKDLSTVVSEAIQAHYIAHQVDISKQINQ